jgi:hypothetical protein
MRAHSSTDRTRACGARDLGSIPSGRIEERGETRVQPHGVEHFGIRRGGRVAEGAGLENR